MLLTRFFTAGLTSTDDFLRREKIDIVAILEAKSNYSLTLLSSKSKPTQKYLATHSFALQCIL